MKTKLKTLVKVAKQRSRSQRFPIVFHGQTATATNDTTELTLHVPIDWSGSEPNDGVKLSADNVSKLAECLGDADHLTIEVSGNYATVNGVRFMMDGRTAGHIVPNDDERTELEVTDELLEAVAAVRDCVGNDDLRSIYKGIYIDSAIVAATDAHVLAWRDVATGLPDGVSAVILPSMFDVLPEGCRTIRVGSEYNIAESDAGRVICARPMAGTPFPDVRRVIPSKNNGTVVLSGAAIRDAFKSAEKRKLKTVALVVRDGAAGMEFYENIKELESDRMAVSLPSRVIDGSSNAIILLSVENIERVLGKRIPNKVQIKYKDEMTAVTVNGCALVMSLMNMEQRGSDFRPDAIDLDGTSAESSEQEQPEPVRQRIVELPDGTYVVIGGRKPKGGRTVKAWIIDNIDEI